MWGLPDSITVEDLLANNYKSTPRNKLIADFCKSIGIIEKYGSGIRRIVEYFTEAQLPCPEFRNISDGFMVTAFALKKVNDPVNDPVNIRLDTIFESIKENNKITREQLSQKCNVSIETIKRDLQKLKSVEKITRVGPDKTGHWKITNKPSQDETN